LTLSLIFFAFSHFSNRLQGDALVGAVLPAFDGSNDGDNGKDTLEKKHRATPA
jgi:hypothetical protein